MLWFIWKYEFRKCWRDHTLLAFSLFVVGFVAIALFNGKSWKSFQERNIEKMARAEREEFAHFKQKSAEATAEHTGAAIPWSAHNNPTKVLVAKQGYAWKKPLPMAVLHIGQGDLYPYYHLISGISNQGLLLEDEVANPTSLLIGKIDIVFLLVYLLPIVVLAWGFDVFPKEKASGTYDILVSQNLGIKKYIWAKLLFRWCWVAGLYLIPLLIGLLLLEPVVFTQQPVPFLAFSVLSLLYLFFWVSLAYFVNSYKKNAVVNGMVLVASWLVLLFVLPSGINLLTKALYPVPPRENEVLLQREVAVNIDREQALEEFLDKNPGYRPQKTGQPSIQSIGDFHKQILAYFEKAHEHTSPYKDSIQHQLLGQQKMVDRHSWLSPSLLVQMIAGQYSGNNLYHFMDYQQNLKDFTISWRKYIGKELFQSNVFTPEKYDGLPVLSSQTNYAQAPTLLWSVSLLSMAVYMALFVYVGNANFTKYDD